jgi:hypothetical protein
MSVGEREEREGTYNPQLTQRILTPLALAAGITVESNTSLAANPGPCARSSGWRKKFLPIPPPHSLVPCERREGREGDALHVNDDESALVRCYLDDTLVRLEAQRGGGSD